MKAIHWKLSGKLDDLIVREPGLPIDNSLMMILDKRLPADGSVSAELIDRTTELFCRPFPWSSQAGNQPYSGLV